MNHIISIIAAMDDKKGIGKDGKLSWYIPNDLKRFKSLTTGHPIIMGRKTFESIGRVLPGRTNIVVTGNLGFKIKDLASQGQALRSYVVNSLENAIEAAKKSPESEEIFIIGGGQVYKEAIKLADKLYLTLVKGDFGADIFFPDYSEFKVISEKKHQTEKYNYRFVNLVRSI